MSLAELGIYIVVGSVILGTLSVVGLLVCNYIADRNMKRKVDEGLKKIREQEKTKN